MAWPQPGTTLCGYGTRAAISGLLRGHGVLWSAPAERSGDGAFASGGLGLPVVCSGSVFIFR